MAPHASSPANALSRAQRRPTRPRFGLLALGVASVIACSRARPALSVASQAPEYAGSSTPEPVAETPPTAHVAREVPSPSTPPPATTVAPAVALTPGVPQALNDGLYRIAADGLELVVDPARGGNVVRLSLEGHELLSPSKREPMDEPFTARVEGERLSLLGPVRADGTRVELRYRLDGTRRALELSESVVNESAEERRVELGATRLRFEAGFEVPLKDLPGARAHVGDGVLCVTLEAPTPAPTELAPGATLTRTTRVHLRALPPSIAARKGNPELAGFVKAMVP